MQIIKSLRPRQNGRRFPDDTFKRIFVNENVRIAIKISLKFVPKGPINNNPALVKIMAWRRSGDKPLSEPMMVSLLTHICVTRPQCVKWMMLNIRLVIWTLTCCGLMVQMCFMQWSESSLVQVMAGCLFGINYLKQRWLFVSWTIMNQWNLNQNAKQSFRKMCLKFLSELEKSAIIKCIFFNKIHNILLKFHWSLFARIQLTKSLFG